jgi:hypothetical protein
MMSLNIGRSSEGEIEHEDGIYILLCRLKIYIICKVKRSTFFFFFFGGRQKGPVTRTKDF